MTFYKFAVRLYSFLANIVIDAMSDHRALVSTCSFEFASVEHHDMTLHPNL